MTKTKKTNQTMALLGFAQNAGKLISGASQVDSKIKRKEIELLILAEDASNRIAKDIILKCETKGIKCFIVGKKTELGLAIGKSPRTAIGVMDKGFAQAILKNLE